MEQNLTLSRILDVLQTIAVHLIAQVVQHLHKFVVVGARINRVVKELVRLCDSYHILCIDRLAETDARRFKPFDIVRIHALHREFHRKIFERAAHFEYVP